VVRNPQIRICWKGWSKIFMKLKLTYLEIKKIFDDKNCKLLEPENYIYKWNHKLKYTCHCGNETSALFKAFVKQKYCSECFRDVARKNSLKYNYEYVKTLFENKNCILLTPKEHYMSVKQKLKYRCHCSNETETWVHNLKKNNGCFKCIMGKLDFNEVKIFFENNGCELISPEKDYVGWKSKLKYICKCGKVLKKSYYSFSHRIKCRECVGSEKLSYEKLIDLFKEKGCELLSKYDEYKNITSKLRYKCKCGKILKISVHSFIYYRDFGCRNCLSGMIFSSKQQNYINNIVNGKVNYFFERYYLDIALIDKKIYIEYDGGGHNILIKRGQITKEEFNKKQINRYIFLKSKGWKEIQIISSKDLLPDEELIKNLISKSIKYLENGHHVIKIDFDKMKIKCSQFEEDVKCEIANIK